eukprot:1158654-Pelagomonas_calceolata.AAC.4
MFKGGAGGAVDSVVPQLLEGMRKVLLYMCCYAHMSYAGGTVGSVVLQLLEAVNAQGLLVFLYLSMHSIGEVVNAWCPICRPGRASEVWQVLGGPAPHPWVCGHMLSQSVLLTRINAGLAMPQKFGECLEGLRVIHGCAAAGLAVPQKFGECLEGLRVILGVRPQIFNFVLPKLIRQPLMVREDFMYKVACGEGSLHHMGEAEQLHDDMRCACTSTVVKKQPRKEGMVD